MGPVFQPDWILTVHHDGSDLYVSNPYPSLGEKVQIRLRVGAQAPVKQVYLRTAPDGEQRLTPLQATAPTPPVRWWEGTLEVSEPRVVYRFLIIAEDGVWWYNAAGATPGIPTDAQDFVLLADYAAPTWVLQSVFYQIFPDRFANGDPSNDPRPNGVREVGGIQPYLLPWGAEPPTSAPHSFVFYGGDLEGIRQQLDYLQALGVNALYLNPIFPALSNHRYDVTDYNHVDPRLGGDEALIALRRELDARAMHYILDVVPNHCGAQHPWFLKAQADPDASEASFFTFTRHPDLYECWLGVKRLPKLNYRSAELRRRMYEDSDSVFRRWLRPPFRADGWRIDVANMLARQGALQYGPDVARGIRRAVKDVRPDAYLIGENFFDATPQLQGDQWDGVMNYLGFAMPLWHWLRGFRQGAWGLHEEIRVNAPWPTMALEQTWRNVRASIPWTVALQQYNLLDSHDVPRIRSVVEGNDALHRLAVIVLMTYPGVPSLYYGDEIGLRDTPRLGPRGCMIWDEARWDHDLLHFHRQLIALRRSSPVLQQGGFQMLWVDKDTFAYQRASKAGRILVVAHRGTQPRPPQGLRVDHGGVPDGAHFIELFSGQGARVINGHLQLPEQPQGATLWQQVS